jgi:hypothetical protein
MHLSVFYLEVIRFTLFIRELSRNLKFRCNNVFKEPELFISLRANFLTCYYVFSFSQVPFISAFSLLFWFTFYLLFPFPITFFLSLHVCLFLYFIPLYLIIYPFGRFFLLPSCFFHLVSLLFHSCFHFLLIWIYLPSVSLLSLFFVSLFFFLLYPLCLSSLLL